jgi:hypothetical protein
MAALTPARRRELARKAVGGRGGQAQQQRRLEFSERLSSDVPVHPNRQAFDLHGQVLFPPIKSQFRGSSLTEICLQLSMSSV